MSYKTVQVMNNQREEDLDLEEQDSIESENEMLDWAIRRSEVTGQPLDHIMGCLLGGVEEMIW